MLKQIYLHFNATRLNITGTEFSPVSLSIIFSEVKVMFSVRYYIKQKRWWENLIKIKTVTVVNLVRNL